ncbi:pyridoxamine 5'-phosphate oxidase family protein [Gordonia sp. NPDC058843]|uniref:pyridoxamine 5'-phosphate oxidase family protein n=1 Tax=Gordonia sp. NPDC058843 TaxID=3346648 RepID=UPI00369F0DC7
MSDTAATSSDTLTADDLEFLGRPLLGFFSTATGPTPPQPRPVWFEATAEGTIQLFTGPDSVKVRRLDADPRASIVVATPVEERERWISVSGPAVVETDNEAARELAARLADRYWDLDDPTRAQDLAEILADDWVRIVIRPEKIRRLSF